MTNKKDTHNMCSHKDHEAWSRRSFIKALGFTGASTMAFANTGITFAKQSKLNAAIAAADNDNILIIIQLFGGNDGLNMIVPINQYDDYANARPNIKHAESDLWNMSDEYGMTNAMTGLESLWKEDRMKVVHSVGYENHIQSHFKGADIFNSAQVDSQESGWLGRHFEEIYPDYLLDPPESPTAIQIGSLKNITFNGIDDTNYSFSVANISRLALVANTGLNYSLEGLPDCTHGDKLRFVRAAVNSTYTYADVIHEAYERSSDYTEGDGYPDNNFSSSLSVISRLIKGNLGTKVYMFTVSGFDTHATQADDQPQLLQDLADSIAYFQQDMKDAGWEDKILSMVVSEFGRRVAENGSNGTDHGTSYPLMLFGSGLNGSGFVGEHASLKTEDLISGKNLEHHTDFRNVYATVLKEWLCVDSSVVDNTILEKEYETLNLGFSCATASNGVHNTLETLSASILIEDRRSYILLNNNATQHVVIKLYTMSGQEVGVIENDFLLSGTYKINVKESIPKRLAQGPYIYRIVTNSGIISKVIPIS